MSPRKPLADALRATVAAEDDAVSRRFARADQALAIPPAAHPPVPPATASPGVARLAFSLPPDEAARVEDLLLRAAHAGARLNRSEIVRAALNVLAGLSDDEFAQTVVRVKRLKPGREQQR